MVFFRAQDGLTNELQKTLILRLGALSGRPDTSSLHIHPILNSERELGGSDPEISTISSVQHNAFYKARLQGNDSDAAAKGRKQASAQWHSDIAFEPAPADYSSLRLVELPSTGGGMSDPLISLTLVFICLASVCPVRREPTLTPLSLGQTRCGPRATTSTTGSARRTSGSWSR